mgnify:CR=1 FL=1
MAVLMAAIGLGGLLAALPLWIGAARALGLWLPSSSGRDFAFDFMLYGLLALAIPLNRGLWERLFLAALFLSMIFAYGNPWKWTSLTIYVVVFLALYAIQTLAAAQKHYHRHILIAITAFAGVNLAWGIIQFIYGGDPIRIMADQPQRSGALFITGFLDNPDHFGALIAIAAPAALYLAGKRYLLLIPTFAVLTFGVFLSKSIFALLAFGGGTIVYLVLMERTWDALIVLILGAALIAAVALLYGKPTRANIALRSTIVKRTLALSMQTPIFGHGLGYYWWHFKILARDVKDPPRQIEHAHNEYAEVLFESGLFGLISLIGLMLSYLVKIVFALDREAYAAGAILAAFAINAVGFYPARVPLLALILVLAAAILKSYDREAMNG